jgi:hypothetical protein
VFLDSSFKDTNKVENAGKQSSAKKFNWWFIIIYKKKKNKDKTKAKKKQNKNAIKLQMGWS